jgi:hypothetical protein
MKLSFWKTPSPYRKQALIAFGIFAGLLVVFLISSDFYPILIVDGSAVSARRFSKNYRAASFYQDNLIKTYGQGQSPIEPVSGKDLEAMVLNQLVEAKLVDAGVRREVEGDLEYLVAGKIQKYDESRDLKGAATSLYGMPYSDFREEVLVPQAERDILAGRLYLRGESVEEWLAREKESAQVTVFSKRFRWDGNQIVPD